MSQTLFILSVSLTSLLANDFINGEYFVSFIGDAPLVGIYFLAHWCSPCRGFTSKLKEFYNNIISQGTLLPILFESTGQDEDIFASYFAEIPLHVFNFGDDRIKSQWHSLTRDSECKDRRTCDKLSRRYGWRRFSSLHKVVRCQV
mmetsp:Transcript_21364/g.21699  ORF Transcript_21364/g.21699 Transcript_21364/m.21699 type:complete len:145 (-) Transcript_21364:161-595(-)